MKLSNLFKPKYILFGSAIVLAPSFVHAACATNPGTLNGGSVADLKSALQGASNDGTPLTITGTFTIDKPVQVWLRDNVDVTATGAKFVATSQLDGDMISIDASQQHSAGCGGSSNGKVNVTWIGGEFDMHQALVSTTVPFKKLTSRPEGAASTADALSVRGFENSTGFHKLDELSITDITFFGTDPADKNGDTPFYDAGGDSGIFVSSAQKATVSNNEFYGVRDAAIYMSADNFDGTIGDEFTMENNTIRRAFDGVTSKRGADDIVMRNNDCNDVAVCLSIKTQTAGRRAERVTIEDNNIVKGVRAISLQHVDGTTVKGNTISRLGDKVAKLDNAVSGPQNIQSFSTAYEAISLIGTVNMDISDNDISASTNRPSSNTWGIVYRAIQDTQDNSTTPNVNEFVPGVETCNISTSGNSFSGLDKNTPVDGNVLNTSDSNAPGLCTN